MSLLLSRFGREITFGLFLFFSIHCFGADLVSKELFDAQFLKKCDLAHPLPEDVVKINLCHACAKIDMPDKTVSPELFQALKSADIFTVLSRHLHTGTQFGSRAVALQCLYGFTDNIQDLLLLQERIKCLDHTEFVAQQLSNIFKQMARSEAQFLSLFKPLDAQAKIEHEVIERKLYFMYPLLKRYNENPYIIGTVARINASAVVNAVYDFAMVPIVLKFNSDTSKDFFPYKMGRAIVGGVQEIYKGPELMTELYEPRFGRKFALYLTAQYYAAMCFQMYISSKLAGEISDLIGRREVDLIEASHLIRSLQHVSCEIAKNEELKRLIPEHALLAQLFDADSEHVSKNLKYLISQLLSSSFKSDSSCWVSNYGKILAVHHLLNRIKWELIPYLQAAGKIDAYLAAYKLYATFKNHDRLSFCFPEFVQQDTPLLVVQEYWHPLIDVSKVITNSLSMGISGSDANLIITGPNAGGKTTSLMSLIINIIFAQSFGIAPSKSLRLTPFAKIHSCLDITTNLQEGLSLFAAEVDRVKKLKASIVSCVPGQKTFTIIDEMFSGTHPDVAAKLGFDFASKLGSIPYSMTIITTHFPHLTTIEQASKRFENYKVADAVVGSNGKLIYPFKLVKGVSTQNIAQHMLEAAGVI